MNYLQLDLFLRKLIELLNYSLVKSNILLEYLKQLNHESKIRIKKFAFDLELDEEQAKEALEILCEMKILKKIENAYICSNCGNIITILTKWDEGDDIICNICHANHPSASMFDTETVYSLYEEPTLKSYNVEFLDKYEKDSNGNNLPRKIKVAAYTKLDAESLVHEYYHYIQGSIKVSTGFDIQNKMILKEYN